MDHPGDDAGQEDAAFPPPVSPALAAITAPDVPFTVGNAFNLGWKSFTSCYGPLLGVSAIFIGIGMGIGIRLVGAVIPLADFVLDVLIGWALYPGMAYVGIRACREGRAEVGDMFVGFQCYGRSLLVALLLTLIGLACMIPVGAAAVVVMFTVGTQVGVFAIITLIVAIVTGFAAWVYCTVRFGFAYGLIIDPVAGRLAAMDAMSFSWELTREFRWGLIGLYILVGMILCASIVLACVGYLFLGLPLGLGVAGASYWLIVGRALAVLCRNCGYDLTGAPGPYCPECGAVSD